MGPYYGYNIYYIYILNLASMKFEVDCQSVIYHMMTLTRVAI